MQSHAVVNTLFMTMRSVATAIDNISSSRLLRLAPELLEAILQLLEPPQLSRFGRTCRIAHDFVQPSNQILWRSSFLQVFDDPTKAWKLLQPTARRLNARRESAWNWHRESCRRYMARLLVRRGDEGNDLSDVEVATVALLDLFETSTSSSDSLNLEFLEGAFHKTMCEWMIHDYKVSLGPFSLRSVALSERLITRSMVVGRAVPDWASRFHVIYGLTSREVKYSETRAAARAIVYDWSATGPDADYGPFHDDNSGNINWQVLEAVTNLMTRCLQAFEYANFRVPQGFRDNMSYITPSTGKDWAGVSRSWLGTYAFLDYRDLVHYNFTNTAEHHMHLADFEEACGDLMQLRLEVDDSEELKNDPRLETTLPVCDDLPMLYFTGESSGRRSGQPRIQCRGTVSLVPGGRYVRWRFFIRYAGADQWQLEGVQPGGIRSGGIFGVWTHCDHENNGPIGPFCYFPSELCDTAAPVLYPHLDPDFD